MGRLIDADAFIQDITDEITNLRMNGLKGTPRPTSELYEIIDRVNEQPTAYDVDAVVEQLKHPTNYTIMAGKHFTTVERAIDIVRKGGKDGC